MRFVDELFENEPKQWGLRGDQYLWRELRIKLATVELPPTRSGLHRLLERAFYQATGESLSFCNEVWIERFAHGGMSSGIVSGEFWRSQGFPLIVERFLAIERH